MNRTQLIETMEWQLSRTQKEVAEFAAKLGASNDPLYELSWSSAAIAASAQVSVIRPYLAALKEGVEFSKLHTQLMNEVLRSARSPEQSTSAVHNVCGLAGQSARAELLEQFNNVVEG